MTTPPNDPIQDLMKEIEGEEAAEAARQSAAGAAAADEQIEETEQVEDAEAAAAEEGTEAAAGEGQEGADKDGKSDKAKKLVPASRLDEETAKRRIAERKAAAAEARIAALERSNQPKTEEDGEKTPEQVRAEVREQVKREMKVESWLAAAHEQYGEEEFETRSRDLAELGAPEFFLPVLFEALDDNMKRAATAVYLLAEQDPAEIQKVFKMTPIRMATYMQKLVSRRQAREDEEEAPRTAKPKTVPKAPKPISPVRTGQAVNGYSFSDDMSEEEFSANFSKMMEKRPN